MLVSYLKKIGVLLLLVATHLQAQTNCTLLGNLPYPQGLSNLWGYAADGREYAIVGTRSGTSVVDVTIPTAPAEVGFISGGQTMWREVKTFGHYAYVVEENVSEGLVVIDLSQLPNTITATNWYGNGDISFTTAHTLYIDENGILYVFGANYGLGGAIMADLSADPTNPPILGVFNERYIHDGYVRNDTLWAAEINDGQLDVVNVTDKSNPIVMASFNTPNNFTHNCWLSDDGTKLYTTDEVFGAYVASYDVSDLSDIKELDRIQSNPGSFSPPHNTYVVNHNFLPTSYYTDGVVIFDATYPDNLIQIGNYDTSPLTGGDFNGAWGVYPYLPSQNLLVSDMQEGLFVIRPTYNQAAYLRGVITDADSGNAIAGVFVTIQGGTEPTQQTGFGGNFATGTIQGGTYNILFEKPGYQSLTLNDIVLTNGQETSLMVELTALPSFTLIGMVLDTANAPIANAQVLFTSSNGLNYETTTNTEGNYTIPSFVNGVYDIIVGKWGYVTQKASSQAILFGAVGPNMVLPTGYYDDFALNFGWVSSGTTPLGGEWGLGDPIGTSFSGLPILFQPEDDLAADIGNQCYATGNTGDFLDMVDGGTVVLESPTFDLSNYPNPILNFSLWFMNVSQAGAGNDDVHIRISNGNTTEEVTQVLGEESNPFAGATWQNYSFALADIIEPTATMKLRVEATADFNQFELLEVAFDGFSIVDTTTSVGISPIADNNPNKLILLPNPVTNKTAHFVLNGQQPTANGLQVVVYDPAGREIQRKPIANNGQCDIYLGNIPSGLYIYNLRNAADNILAVGKMILK